MTGDYDMVFYCTGGFFLLSTILCYPLPWIVKREMLAKPGRFSTVVVSNTYKLMMATVIQPIVHFNNKTT